MKTIVMGMVIGVFILLWTWIGFEIHNAPELDENGNLIKKKK